MLVKLDLFYPTPYLIKNLAQKKFTVFYSDRNRKILITLNSETESQYSLTARAVDLSIDDKPDPIRHKAAFAVITINILMSTNSRKIILKLQK